MEEGWQLVTLSTVCISDWCCYIYLDDLDLFQEVEPFGHFIRALLHLQVRTIRFMQQAGGFRSQGGTPKWTVHDGKSIYKWMTRGLPWLRTPPFTFNQPNGWWLHKVQTSQALLRVVRTVLSVGSFWRVSLLLRRHRSSRESPWWLNIH